MHSQSGSYSGPAFGMIQTEADSHFARAGKMMDSKAFDDLTRSLFRLDLRQLEAVEHRIKYLKSQKSKTMGIEEVSGDEHWWIELVAKMMQRRGVDFSRPDAILRKINLPELRRKVQDLQPFLKMIGQPRSVQEAVISIGLDLLHNDLTKMNVPITSAIMAQHLDRLPTVIEQSFPGYAKRGFLPIIVQAQKEANR